MTDDKKKFSRGSKNPHLTTTQKLPCAKCAQRVDHYPDGTISKHKIYAYEEVKGRMVRTNKWHYCDNKKWRQ
jgi:hypothetical protein